jgi:hypothetical protein
MEYYQAPALSRLAESLGVTLPPRASAARLREAILDARTDWPEDYSTWNVNRMRDELERRFPGTRALWDTMPAGSMHRELSEDDARVARGESRDTRLAEAMVQVRRVEQERLDEAEALANARARAQESRAHPDGVANMNPQDLRDLGHEWGVPDAGTLAYDDLVAAVRKAGGLSPRALSQSAFTRQQLERMTQPQLRTLATHRGLNTANLDSKADLIGAIASQFRSSNAPPLRELAESLRTAGSAQARRDLLGAHLDGDYGGLNVRIREVDVSGNTVNFSGVIMRQDGSPAGTVSRRITLPNAQGRGGKVYNAYLTIPSDQQGSGFAEEWNNNLFDWYKRSGIDEVTVTANIDVGGYAWATKGFDFASKSAADGILDGLANFVQRVRQADWDNLSSSHRYDISRVFGANFDPDDVRRQLVEAEALLARARSTRFGRADFPSAYEVSQIGRTSGQGGRDARWLGKGYLLGKSWSGRMYL